MDNMPMPDPKIRIVLFKRAVYEKGRNICLVKQRRTHIIVDGEKRYLNPQISILLWMFLCHKIVDRSDILDAWYPVNTIGYPNNSTNVVGVNICKLRRILRGTNLDIVCFGLGRYSMVPVWDRGRLGKAYNARQDLTRDTSMGLSIRAA